MSPSTDRIEIPLSKSKLVLMLIGALTFVAIGLWFVISPPTFSNSLIGHPAVIAIAGYASIIFFGLCAFVMARKLPDNRPGLIIDENGLTDNSSGVSIGHLPWSEIKNISVLTIHRQKLIVLQVKNPQEYINNQTNGLKKRMMQMNYKMYGTPLSITSNGLKISFNDLLSTLTSKLNTSRQSQEINIKQ